MIDIIIPTRNKPHLQDCLEALKKNTHLPHRVHLATSGNRWIDAVAGAIEPLLGNDDDLVLMDDDIQVLPGWLQDIESYLQQAQVIGFKLLYPDGRIQHAGGIVSWSLTRFLRYPNAPMGVTHRGEGQRDTDTLFAKPRLVPHVTTSLIYMRKAVARAVRFDTTYPGDHYEDIDFNFRALAAGFKILYCPNRAVHLASGTKRDNRSFVDDSRLNSILIYNRFLMDRCFIDYLYAQGFIKYTLFSNTEGMGNYLRSKLKSLCAPRRPEAPAAPNTP